jgi:hypothetical protein
MSGHVPSKGAFVPTPATVLAEAIKFGTAISPDNPIRWIALTWIALLHKNTGDYGDRPAKPFASRSRKPQGTKRNRPTSMGCAHTTGLDAHPVFSAIRRQAPPLEVGGTVGISIRLLLRENANTLPARCV